MEEELMETDATNQRLVLLRVSPRSEFLLLLLLFGAPAFLIVTV